MQDDARERYWRANRNLILLLLAIWALVSFGFAILLARPLASVAVGSLPMGFWWAQQGSMIVFVALIFVYARRMDTLDERYDVDEERPRRRPGPGSRPKGTRPRGTGPNGVGGEGDEG